ncbi:MAG: glycosyltransferase [Clostridia bacterium]
MKKKNIAIFQYDLFVGGIQKSIINTINCLGENYNIDLYIFNRQIFYKDEISSNVNIIYIKDNKLLKRVPFKIYKLLTKNFVLDKVYDVAIDYNGYQNCTAFGVYKANAKKKVIWIHNDVEKRYQEDFNYRILYNFQKSKYKIYDKFVFVSKRALNSFKKMYKKDINSVVISNQIDDENIIKKSKEKVDIVVDKNKYNVVTLGRLVSAKGFDILLNKISELLEYRQDFHLYIIGDGPEKNKLVQMTERLKIKEYVTFLGKQDNPYKYMALMDGFVLTSRHEGQGIAVLEAKVLGLDLYLSKSLEETIENVTGYDNIVDGLKDAKKQKEKKYVRLDDYNRNNKAELEKLMK